MKSEGWGLLLAQHTTLAQQRPPKPTPRKKVIDPKPCILHPTPYALYPTPYTLRPTPYTYTLRHTSSNRNPLP